ncbi:MFS transporter [Carnimonas nigrificans]|uniref:MFS transporter n=1 Tax=Carnimonas nigrificans TaxID=64323 RepID=UPI00046EF03F|nr:MFS transporter [Carnimonas nigrificans]
MSLPLLALAMAAFGIGTTELVIMGLLTDVADNLSVTVPAAGMLISGYAMGVVVGGPILALITSRWQRKRTLILLMSIFLIGNIACAISETYAQLMIARVITALSHGAFFGIASVTAAGMVPPEKRGQAIAMVFAGLTIANVLGVPMGTAIGQALGWRMAFWGVALLGVVALVGLWRWMPSRLPLSKGSMLAEFVVLKQPQVSIGLGMSVLASTAMFTTLAYFAPILEKFTGVHGVGITLMFLLYGVGMTIGSWLGGRLGSHPLVPTLIKLMIANFIVLLVLTFCLHSIWTMVPAVVLWGAITFSPNPLFQLLVVDRAAEAPNLASTLNQSAFNLGNAVGAWLGGMVISIGVREDFLPLVSLAIMAILFVVALASRRLFANVTDIAPAEEVPAPPPADIPIAVDNGVVRHAHKEEPESDAPQSAPADMTFDPKALIAMLRGPQMAANADSIDDDAPSASPDDNSTDIGKREEEQDGKNDDER